MQLSLKILIFAADNFAREPKVPSFYFMVEDELRKLITEKLETDEFHDFYLVEIEVKDPNKILIFVDSDSGVKTKDCAVLSRYIEEYLDEENWKGGKYVLEVSSPGIDRPLKFPRQYVKNIGRKIEIKTHQGEKLEGKLIEANDDYVVIQYRDKIKDGKKKKNIIKQTEITHDTIEKAKIKISFK